MSQEHAPVELLEYISLCDYLFHWKANRNILLELHRLSTVKSSLPQIEICTDKFPNPKQRKQCERKGIPNSFILKWIYNTKTEDV